MTRKDFALLLAPALPLAPLLLALSACGGDAGEANSKRKAPSAPLGFELAMAVTADDSASVPAPLVPLSPDQLAARIKAGNVRLIDVRTDAEVAEGTIPGAEHIPLDRFDPAALDFATQGLFTRVRALIRSRTQHHCMCHERGSHAASEGALAQFLHTLSRRCLKPVR